MIPMDLTGRGLWKLTNGKLTTRGGGEGGDRRVSTRVETIADRAGATQWVNSVVRRAVRWPTAPSGREWQCPQSGHGAVELGFPGPALRQIQAEAPSLAGDATTRLAHGFLQPRLGRSVASLRIIQGCGPSPGRPARRRWRRSGPRGDD